MENKKEQIVNEAGQLFLRYGIRSVTMDDVSRELGISKKTLYQYFRDKEELVAKVVDVLFLNNPCLHLSVEPGLNAIDRVLRIREHVHKMFKLLQNNIDFDMRKLYPKVYQKVIEFKRVKIYNDNYSVLEQGKTEGLFRPDLDSDVLARLAVGRFLLVLNPDNGIFTEEETHDIHLFDQLVDYHFHGICTEKGLQYYKQQLNNVQHEN